MLNGSGTFDAIAARRTFGDELLERFPFDAFVSKTITLAPRQGNPPPRLWETPAGLINSIGLPNKGLEGFLESDLPQLAELPVPLVVSVMGFSRDELADARRERGRARRGRDDRAERVVPERRDRLSHGRRPRGDRRARSSARARSPTKPLIVKLTPNATEPQAVAAAAEEAGADAVSLINTLKGMALHPRTGDAVARRRSGRRVGPGGARGRARAGLHGRRARVEIPVIGMGGIQTGRHAADFMRRARPRVAVGTESFRDPAAGARVADELGVILAL